MLLKFLEKLGVLNNPLRPPGALPAKDFDKHCIRCRRCMEVCPYQSIRMAHGNRGPDMGKPYIIARDTPCYLCDDFPCIAACPTDALQDVENMRAVNMGLARIDQGLCLAYNGIICRACYERCPIYGEAITLDEQLYPKVHREHCVGCGICEHVCPTEPKSIVVMSAHQKNSYSNE